MVTKNSIDSNIPIEITKGGTNATSMSTSDGILKYDGTSLVTSSTALIDSSNRKTNSAQSSFFATNSATQLNVTGDNTIYQTIPNTEIFDQNSNYNNATGVYTAPIAGKYLFLCTIAVQELSATNTTDQSYIYTTKKNYDSNWFNWYAGRGSSYMMQDIILIADMDAGDTSTLRVRCGATNKVVDVLQAKSSIYLLC